MNTWVNMTPHRLTIRRDDGSDVIIPPCNEVLRVDTDQIKRGETDGIRINEVRPSQSAIEEAMERVREHLTVEANGNPRVVIVSGIALDWLAPHLTGDEIGRVLSPDTSPASAIREGGGRVTAVRALRMAAAWRSME